jgi:hypothetical protein
VPVVDLEEAVNHPDDGYCYYEMDDQAEGRQDHEEGDEQNH